MRCCVMWEFKFLALKIYPQWIKSGTSLLKLSACQYKSNFLLIWIVLRPFRFRSISCQPPRSWLAKQNPRDSWDFFPLLIEVSLNNINRLTSLSSCLSKSLKRCLKTTTIFISQKLFYKYCFQIKFSIISGMALKLLINRMFYKQLSASSFKKKNCFVFEARE